MQNFIISENCYRFQPGSSVNLDFRDTKYCRNKAGAEAHPRFQVPSIIRAFKLMYSSKQPHLSLERLTYNNLYCFIGWLHRPWGSVGILASKKKKRPRSTLHLSLLYYTSNSRNGSGSVKYFSLEKGSKDEKVWKAPHELESPTNLDIAHRLRPKRATTSCDSN